VNTDLLQADYDHYRSQLKRDEAARKAQRRAGNAAYFTIQVLYTLYAARLGYLFDAPPAEVIQTLRDGLPDLIAVIDLGGSLSPIEMRKYLGAALLTEDPRLVRWLTRLPDKDFTLENLKVSDALYDLVRALQAGGRGDAAAFADAVAKFRAALAPKRLVVSPRTEKAIYAPLADLLEAIVAGDQAAFDQAWRNQGAAWKKRYGRPAETANVEGLLDMEALGIGKIARKFNLKVPPDNPYAPLELLDAGKAS
jgi:hypothetical protein